MSALLSSIHATLLVIKGFLPAVCAMLTAQGSDFATNQKLPAALVYPLHQTPILQTLKSISTCVWPCCHCAP